MKVIEPLQPSETPQQNEPVPAPPEATTPAEVPNIEQAPVINAPLPGQAANKHNSIAKLLLTILVAAGLAGAGLLLIGLLSPMKTQSLTNGGYTYTFKFYKAASEVQAGNRNALKDDTRKVIAGGQPTTDRDLSSCSSVGSAWREAFRVTINGTDRPVCSEDNNRVYLANFEAFDHRHDFILTYMEAQPDTTAAKTIFSSIHVSQ